MRRQRRARPHVRRNIKEMDATDLTVWKVLAFHKFFEGRKAAEQAAQEKRIGLEVPINATQSNFTLVDDLDCEIPYLQSKVHVRFNAGGWAFVEVFRPLPEDVPNVFQKEEDGSLRPIELEICEGGDEGEVAVAVSEPGGTDA